MGNGDSLNQDEFIENFYRIFDRGLPKYEIYQDVLLVINQLEENQAQFARALLIGLKVKLERDRLQPSNIVEKEQFFLDYFQMREELLEARTQLDKVQHYFDAAIAAIDPDRQ